MCPGVGSGFAAGPPWYMAAMGIHLTLIIHEGSEARPGHGLASVVAALAASGDIDPKSWSVEPVHGSDRGVAEFQERARRERWSLQPGQRTSTARLLEFLSTTDEQGLGLSVTTPVSRCDLRCPTHPSGAQNLLETAVAGDVQLDFHKVGFRYLAAPESDERIVQIDEALKRARHSDRPQEFRRLLKQRREAVPSIRDEHLQYLLEFITRLAAPLRPRAIRACLDSHGYAPPEAVFAWYRDEAALLGDAVLTARWLEEVGNLGAPRFERLLTELDVRELIESENAATLLRALDVETVRRVLAADTTCVLQAGAGFFLVNLEMDPLRACLAPFFARLARAALP